MFGNNNVVESIMKDYKPVVYTKMTTDYIIYDADAAVPSDNRPVWGEIASVIPNDKQKAVPCLVMYYDKTWWAINPGLINFKPEVVRVYKWMEVPK
jgi:hypothetical protein